MKNLLVSLGLCGLALLPARAGAHEYWLAPSRYAAAARDTIAIAAFVGTGFRGERKPYATPRAVHFTLTGPRTLDLRPAAMNGDLTFARFIAADDRGTLVAYESNFTSIELAPDDFDRYLRLEGLDAPLAARAKLGLKAGSGRERYARCPKTWIAGSDLARAFKPAGLTIELVPLDDPTTAAKLRLKLLFHGRPLPGALVRAWNQPLAGGAFPRDAAARDSVGPKIEVRSDRGGLVTLPLEATGEWLVSAVHMEPSRDREVADWESFWASITFARGIKRP